MDIQLIKQKQKSTKFHEGLIDNIEKHTTTYHNSGAHGFDLDRSVYEAQILCQRSDIDTDTLQTLVVHVANTDRKCSYFFDSLGAL